MEVADLENSLIVATDLSVAPCGEEAKCWPRVVEQKLFPAKAKQRRLPFSIVKAGEKKGLEVTVRAGPDWVDPPECRLTDQDGNEVPWIKDSPAPKVKRRSSDTFTYEFQLGSESGVFRIKFLAAPGSAGGEAETRGSCLSHRFAVIRNTGKDRPEMKHAFGSLLWLSFRDLVLLLADSGREALPIAPGLHGPLTRLSQLDNSPESALRCVSEALHAWLGVRVLRSAADIDWFIAQAPHLGSSGVTEDAFGGLIDSLRKPLQLIEPSPALTRLWHSCDLFLPLFLPDAALDQLLVEEEDFALRVAQGPRKFRVVWRYQGAIRYCLLEWQTMARGGEMLWEIARDPLFRRTKHTAIDSLPRLLDEFAPLQRFVYIDAEGRLATLAKPELTRRLLAAHLGAMDDDDDDDTSEEEVNLSVSITAELEDLQRPFNHPLPQSFV